jgi:hypothetical protein
MASPNIFPNGLARSGTNFDGGADLVDFTGCYFSGGIQWLDTVNGNNSNSGSFPNLPVQTLAQAVTNVSAGGLIVIAKNSTFSLGSSQSFAKAFLTVLGMGTGNTRPRFTCTGAGINMLDATAAATRFYNLYFAASTAAVTSRIRFTAAEGAVRNCYFECGASDTVAGNGVLFGASSNSVRIRDTYFVSTASRPAAAVSIPVAVTDPTFENVTFDGGAYGWSAGYALSVSTAAPTRIWAENMRFLGDSSCGDAITGTTYQTFGLSTEGGSLALFTA